MLNGEKMTNFKQTIISNLVLFPAVCHWLLPSGIESALYVGNSSILFFIPSIAYFLYIGLYHHLNIHQDGLLPRPALFFLVLTFFLWEFFGIIANNCNSVVNRLINGNSFIILLLIYSFFPLDREHLEKTAVLLIPSLFIIIGEVSLYGLGVLTYTSEAGDVLGEGSDTYGMITRVSSTIGAATGTAIIVCVLGIISICVYSLSDRFKFIIALLVTIALFFTVSRGSIIVWILFILYYVYKHYYRRSPFFRRLGILLVVCISLFVLYRFDVFEPVVERSESLSDFSTGRDERFSHAIEIYNQSHSIGVGLGQVFPDKSISSIVKSPYRMGPHNLFLVVLAETGLLGLILFILTLLIVLIRLDYSKEISLAVWLVILINCNTECCFVYYEFMVPLLLLCMASLKTR